MAKQQVSQRYILKLNSKDIREANWNFDISLSEARRKKVLISLIDSQVLRWIDELNDNFDGEQEIRQLRKRVKEIHSEPSSIKNRNELNRIYSELDKLQYRPDYLNVIMDSKSDYKELNKGFCVNGIKYHRLLGTTGGVKKSTIVYVSERLYPELKKRITNGRNLSCTFVPAKLEAYQALTCSGSIPVSDPSCVLVVPDCVTHFKDDIIEINTATGGEPSLVVKKDYDCELDASDGYGLITYNLANRWSRELLIDTTLSGCCIRNAFCKGMVFPFPIREFFKKVALPAGKSNMVKDAWGNYVDINRVDMILTTSMLKLWDSYESFEDYWNNCKENHYTFAVTKTCEEELDEERKLNYQFLQGYHFTDEQIDELIKPTCDEIKDVICGDYSKALLFLNGSGMKADKKYIDHLPNNWIKALMICPGLFKDSYIQKSIQSLIKVRIKDTKIGKIKVAGNFQVLSGDPYALCQSIFGLEITGLLAANTVYSKFWVDKAAPKVVLFRAPMTNMNNIRKMNVCASDECRYWFQYMKTVMVINAWDNTMAAMNGLDFDGDTSFSTNNKVLLDSYEPTLPIYCVQEKATKKIPSESDFIKANMIGFGDDIGVITNHATSMYDVQAKFPRGSKEYEEIQYRILCSQAYQQSSIDRIKGVLSPNMPNYWYSASACKIKDGDTNEVIEFKKHNAALVASVKPYFMSYIYPEHRSRFNKFMTGVCGNSQENWNMDVSDLLDENDENTSEKETFIQSYKKFVPLGLNQSTMNRICWRVEQMMDDAKTMSKQVCGEFDKDILKTDAEYSVRRFGRVKTIFKKICSDYYDLRTTLSKTKQGTAESVERWINATEDLIQQEKRELYNEIQNENELCNALVDICYRDNTSRFYMWQLCSELICSILANQYKTIHIIEFDDCGDIKYNGKLYSERVINIGGTFGSCIE